MTKGMSLASVVREQKTVVPFVVIILAMMVVPGWVVPAQAAVPAGTPAPVSATTASPPSAVAVPNALGNLPSLASLGLAVSGSAPAAPSTPSASCTGSVLGTLSLGNGTLTPTNFQTKGVLGPGSEVYLPQLGDILVSGVLSDSLGLYNASTDKEVGQITLTFNSPYYILQVVYDPTNGYVYVDSYNYTTGVAATEPSLITVVNPVSQSIVAEIPVGNYSLGETMDTADGLLFVSNTENQDLSVINTTTQKQVGLVSIGASTFPGRLDYAPLLHALFVPEFGVKDVARVSLPSLAVTQIAMPEPTGVALAGPNDLIFVTAGSGANALYTLNGSTLALLNTANIGFNVVSMAWDTTMSYIFTTNQYSNNISVVNALTGALVSTIPAGVEPYGAVFDPVLGDVFVSNLFSSNVTVLQGSPLRTIGSFLPGVLPTAPAYDPLSTSFYVPDYTNVFSTMAPDRSALYQVSATSHSITNSVPVGNGSIFATFANTGGYGTIYASNMISHNVSIVTPGAGGTLTVTGALPVGQNPEGSAWDLTNSLLYVTNQGSNNVSMINTTTNTVVGSIPLGTGTNDTSATFDQGNNYLYVSNSNYTNHNLTEIKTTSNTVSGNVAYPHPALGPSAIDTMNGILFVVDNSSTNTVTLMNTGNNAFIRTVGVGKGPSGVYFNPYDQDIYVVNSQSNNLTVLDGAGTAIGSIPVANTPEFMAIDSNTGVMAVSNPVAGTVTFVSPSTKGCYAYPVDFSETGLASGTSWSVTVGTGIATSTTAQDTLYEGNGSYTYTVGAVPGYIASPPSGSFTVVGASVSVAIAFIPLASSGNYTIYFNETGLFAGTTWGVNLSGTISQYPSTSIPFSVGNGTYAYTILPPTNYTATPPSGGITVKGSNVAVKITFTRVVARLYSAWFNETGLAVGTSWAVVVQGVNHSGSTSSILFNEINGTYSFTVPAVTGYTASPAAGTITVVGLAITTPVVFTPVASPGKYFLNFTETGLPGGTSWSMTVQGTLKSGTSTVIAFVEANNSYTYVVGTVSGYKSTPTSGTQTINGANVNVPITFTPGKIAGSYYVNFTESGLATGTSWTVTLGGTPHTSTTSVVSFTMPNGTSAYSVGTVTGFVAYPSSGSASVNGAPTTIPIQFSPVGTAEYAVNFTERGLPTTVATWTVTLGGSSQTVPVTVPTSTMTFFEKNGSYPFTVSPAGVYQPNLTSGTAHVNGLPVSFSITFSHAVPPPTYVITFTETGLPSGTSWSVTLGGATHTSTTTTVAFPEANGSYSFTVGAVSGYTATPSSSSVTVNGGPVGESITFSVPSTNPSQPSSFIPGLSQMEAYGVLLAIVVVVVVLALVLVLRKKKTPPAAGAPGPNPPQPGPPMPGVPPPPPPQ